MSLLTTLIPALIVGVLIGMIARLFVPDPRPQAFTITVSLAVIGAVIAALVGQAQGWHVSGLATRFLVALLGALCLPTAYRLRCDEVAHPPRVASAPGGRAGGAP